MLLTGGASKRMGEEKARLLVDAEPVAVRTARKLADHCGQVTVLGRHPLPNCAFLEDQEEFAGPLAALSYFQPVAEVVFVASCDMPRFDSEIVRLLHSLLGDVHAVVPRVGGRLQPLSAVYSTQAWAVQRRVIAEGGRSMFGWIESLDCRFVDEDEISASGINPASIKGANTPEEWARLMSN